MATGRFISYFRVSTDRQGRSGLGLDAQRAAVTEYLNGGRWTVLAEYTEIESGKDDDRPQLALAMQQCRLTGATLLIAKLDRLSRDAAFLMGLDKAGISFTAADMPDASRFTINIFAALAEHERKMISERTKAALAAAKIRRKEAGLKPLGGCRPNHKPVDGALGVKACQAKAVAFACNVRPMVLALREQGLSLRGVAAELTSRQIRTPRGGAWTAKHVMNVLG